MSFNTAGAPYFCTHTRHATSPKSSISSSLLSLFPKSRHERTVAEAAHGPAKYSTTAARTGRRDTRLFYFPWPQPCVTRWPPPPSTSLPRPQSRLAPAGRYASPAPTATSAVRRPSSLSRCSHPCLHLHLHRVDEEVHLSIDGADKIYPDLNLVKGLRGGSLLRGKMIEGDGGV
nr:uncharacterized protein LOC127337786 [Lolium perenne]